MCREKKRMSSKTLFRSFPVFSVTAVIPNNMASTRLQYLIFIRFWSCSERRDFVKRNYSIVVRILWKLNCLLRRFYMEFCEAPGENYSIVSLKEFPRTSLPPSSKELDEHGQRTVVRDALSVAACALLSPARLFNENTQLDRSDPSIAAPQSHPVNWTSVRGYHWRR